MSAGRQLTRADLAIDPLDAAAVLLGSTIVASTVDGTVAVRIVEVEAYRGLDDPASHSYRGKTARNAVMWGPAGHLYVYFIYGMHFCANIVCLTDGVPGAVLLRAGEITLGVGLAEKRRPASRRPHDLARGPARLAAALGLDREHNGADLTNSASSVRLFAGNLVPAEQIRSGPRVGVAAAHDTPWRFWIDESRAVSTYRRGGKVRPTRPRSRNQVREDKSRE